MAWPRIILFSTWIHKTIHFIMSGYILFLPPFTRGKKNPFGLSWNRNPGPLASQATTITTIPWLLGLLMTELHLHGRPVKDSFTTELQGRVDSCVPQTALLGTRYFLGQSIVFHLREGPTKVPLQ